MIMKVIVTGGHVTPALAVLEQAKKKGWVLFWVGEHRAVGGRSDIKTLESKVIPQLNIPFYSIKSAKLNRGFVLKSLLSNWKIIVGFFQGLWLLIRLRPNALLSFGSYVSVPIGLAAWCLQVPIVIHEQTAASGLANRLVAKLAKKVAITFPDSKKFFPEHKVVVTGNPIRQAIFEIARARRDKGRGAVPVLYITGGSRGSQAINAVVFPALPDLLSKFRIYHQTGDISWDEAQKIKRQLPGNVRGRYSPAPSYHPTKVEQIYKEADMVISRAGANTVLELAATGIPAILIPLPFAGSDEQYKNAKALATAGTALILPQNELTSSTLLDRVKTVLDHLPSFKARAPFASRLAKPDAAARLVALVEEVVER